MLLPWTTEQLDKLRHSQQTYRPGSEVTDQLKTKTLLMFVGPSASGKNTVMDAVAAANARFGLTGNQTSREPRDSDDPMHYRYIRHTDDGLKALFKSIDERQLVQYAVSFYEPHYVYATAANDYPRTYCLKDVFFDAVGAFQALPFKRVVTINLVTIPEVWLPRFNACFPQDHLERPGRLEHAAKTLEWSLAQADSKDHVWIENGADLDKTVAAIIQLAEGNYIPDSARPRAVAQDTLRMLQEINI